MTRSALDAPHQGGDACTHNDASLSPSAADLYAVFLGALLALFLLIQFGVLRYAFGRIGLSSKYATLLLLASLLGSYVNIPIAHFANERVVPQEVIDFFGRRYVVPMVVDWPGMILAVNVGGAVIPLLLSIYLLARNRIWIVAAWRRRSSLWSSISLRGLCPASALACRSSRRRCCRRLSRFLLSRDFAAPVAYVSGSLGTLIGADLLNLDRIRGHRDADRSFGGAGTFDGIFVTGILAVLIASLPLRRRPSGVSPAPP